jgi:hypothetical protein
VADIADSKALYRQDSDTTRGNPRFLPAPAKKQQQRTASHNSQKSSKTTGDNRHPVRASPPSIPRSRPAHRLRVLHPHDFRMPCHYGDSLTLLVSAGLMQG